MAKYVVIAEYTDAKTGKNRVPGEVIEASGARLAALRKAEVIGDEVKDPDGK